MNVTLFRVAYRFAATAAVGCLALSVAQAAGTASYHVALVTTALTGGMYTGPYSMDFQFINGSSAPPNNTATISDFMYGTGGTGPTSVVTLNDGVVPGPGEATVAFTPGTKLDFDVTVTTNQDIGVGASPDSLSFAILDGSDNPIPTSDPADAFFYITESGNALSPAPLVQTYAASSGQGGSFSPTVSAQSASAPEPDGIAYLVAAVGLALLGAAGNARRRVSQ